MKILITGGAGYIGSHTYVEVVAAGDQAVIVDNFSNSRPEVVGRLERITGRPVALLEGDVCDRVFLDRVFGEHEIGAVVHFAGLKSVGESITQPLRYYENNVAGSLALFEAMARHDVRRLVFSSSAAVYGDPASVPVREDFPLSVNHPYGRSKLMVEGILRDLQRADGNWRIMLLRYFNPVGAHASGLIGEDSGGVPNNLMPYVSQVAVGRLPILSVFGNDYPTPDGTGVRDYIHVVDLAQAHVAALRELGARAGVTTVNIGTGRGYSVLELIRAFSAASGREIPFRIEGRRPGDVASCYADSSFAETVLGWKAARGIDEMCADAWNWQVNNPHGYRQAGD